MLTLDIEMIEDIAVGSAILGSGGGGDPYIGKLLAITAVREHGPVPLVSPSDLPDDARVVMVAGIGAPGVLVEKLPRIEDAVRALRLLEARLGYSFTHVCPAEAGGLNALTPIGPAAQLGLPVLDADGMGRAFPSLEMVTPTLYGGNCTPMSLTDEHGNDLVVDAPSNRWAEEIARSVTVASGAIMMMALYPMTGIEAKAWLVHNPLALAAQLGAAVRRPQGDDHPIDAILAIKNGRRLFQGTVVSVERRNERGWTFGKAIIRDQVGGTDSEMVLESQNEHLAAIRDGEVVATTPDLIMVLAEDSAEPIPAEGIRFGQRVVVIGMSCDPQWRTPAGIEVAGPRRFGYDVDYRPIED